VGEVLLKDKFLTQSAPDIHGKLQKSVAEGEKSLDQLKQLAMSLYYNWDVTKKKKIRDIMTLLQLSGKDPPKWGLHPETATIVDRRGSSADNAQKGEAWETVLFPAGTLPSLQR
jgi:hypothetical protein